MNMGVEQALHRLEGDWWATMGRILPYSEGSKSGFVEVYVVTKAEHIEGFGQEVSGRVVDQDRRGGVRDVCVFPKAQARTLHSIRDPSPVLAFFCLHNNCVLRAFRVRTELHFDTTKNKAHMKNFLVQHLHSVHPALTPTFFKCLVLAAKGKINQIKGDLPQRFDAVAAHFVKRIAGYQQALRCEKEKRRERGHTPPPQHQVGGVPVHNNFAPGPDYHAGSPVQGVTADVALSSATMGVVVEEQPQPPPPPPPYTEVPYVLPEVAEHPTLSGPMRSTAVPIFQAGADVGGERYSPVIVYSPVTGNLDNDSGSSGDGDFIEDMLSPAQSDDIAVLGDVEAKRGGSVPLVPDLDPSWVEE